MEVEEKHFGESSWRLVSENRQRLSLELRGASEPRWEGEGYKVAVGLDLGKHLLGNVRKDWTG